MIYERLVRSDLGWFGTVQTYYTCSECKVETNVVLWFISIKAGNYPIEYTCPNCGSIHEVEKSYE